MYPRVKVREQEQDDGFSPEDDSSSLLLLKVFESLSVQDCCSPEKSNENDSPPLVTKIPKTCVPNLAMPLNSVSKGASQLPETKKNNKHVVDDAKPNARASSIPRPRAVVSSPDNDGMIGNMNKLISRRPSTLEKQHPIKKTPAQAKVNPGWVRAESPLRKRIGLREALDKASDNKSSLKQMKSLESAVLRQKACPRKEKQSSMGI